MELRIKQLTPQIITPLSNQIFALIYVLAPTFMFLTISEN